MSADVPNFDIVSKFTLIVNKNGFFGPNNIYLDTKNTFLRHLEPKLFTIHLATILDSAL